MADAANLEISLLTDALRLQKSVPAETAVTIISQDLISRYSLPINLAKMLAEASVAGDIRSIRAGVQGIAKEDKTYKLDLSSELEVGGIKHLPELNVSSNKKPKEAPNTTDEPAPKEKQKPDGPPMTATNADAHDTKKAFSALTKFLPPDCGHCGNGCTCGRAMLKTLSKAFPPQMEDEEQMGGEQDGPPGGEEPGLDGVDAISALPQTGGMDGIDPGAAMMEEEAPSSGGSMESLQMAAQIADMVNSIQELLGGVTGGAGAPQMPPGAMMGQGGANAGPQYDEMPTGGSKGLYMDEEGGGEFPPEEGLRLNAQRLRKALLKEESGTMTTSTPAANQPIVGDGIGDKTKVSSVVKAMAAMRDS